MKSNCSNTTDRAKPAIVDGVARHSPGSITTYTQFLLDVANRTCCQRRRAAPRFPCDSASSLRASGLCVDPQALLWRLTLEPDPTWPHTRPDPTQQPARQNIARAVSTECSVSLCPSFCMCKIYLCVCAKSSSLNRNRSQTKWWN